MTARFSHTHPTEGPHLRPRFGLTAADYAKHRAGFPAELVRRLHGHGIGLPGQRVVDLGTGTGSLARLFARAGADVTGVDRAEQLLTQAAELDGREGLRVAYRVAAAEDTGLPGASYDVVTAGQCWHWFDAPRAVREVGRLLRPGGRAVIAHFDMLPLPGNVVEATEQLIRTLNPEWTLYGSTGLYPRWLTDLAIGGFTGIETFSFDVEVSYTHEAWRGRMRASAGVGASLPPDGVAAFDAELGRILRDRFPDDVLRVPHRTWAVLATAPGSAGG
ncbi:class I SAM-dependent methyltransferase [Streptomyces huiliensis]|uniref:class I SAM-dependent methyltransferase n=1 Tax=Streptomyces huiliensis TaxID=2876027 RepID=UPI001CBFB53E|nr:class I SAM-dependent methyltransferase [Streptomyces huiliensis]MBZ4323432.1 class I SAM-dependent methyltransferase [Streptomyces huiliensis]